jgi:hypothetical protein
MANFKKYLDCDQIHSIECDIYNDKFEWDDHFTDQTIAYRKDFKDRVDSVLLEGEESMVFVNNRGYDQLYTSFGRLMNLRTCKMQKPIFSGKALNFSVGGVPINSIRYHEKNGWEHNVKEMYDRYIEYGWGMRKGSYEH